MKRIGIVIVLAVGCLLLGCRKSTSYTSEDGSKATVTQSGNRTEITVHGKDGAKVQISEAGNLPLPAAFPKDLPVYPGATVTASVTVKEGIQVVFKTADPANKVATFYNDKLKSAGFEIESTMNTEENSMLTAKKGNRTVMVTTSRDSDGTMFTLTVQSEEPPAKE